MTEARTEPTPPGEPQPGSPEILEPGYTGLYGRLLLATQFPEKAKGILNPDERVSILPAFDSSLSRDYNPIAHGLSTTERLEAWRGVDFLVAKDRWKTELTTSINGTSDTDKDRQDAIRLISGKTATDFTPEDAETLYSSFCNGKSDTTAFVHAVTEKLKAESADGKTIDPAIMRPLMRHIQWFAGRFFGKQSSSVVSRMVELEASLGNDEKNTVEAVYKIDKINSLSPEEKGILAPVFKNFEEQVRGAPLGDLGSPAPLGPSEEDEKEAAAQPATPAGPSQPEQTAQATQSTTSEPAGAAEPAVDLKDIPEVGLPPDVTPQNLVATMKSVLSTNSNVPVLNLAVPINIGKEYLVSTLKGGQVKEILDSGQIEIGPNGEVIARGVRLDAGFVGGKITFDLILKNGSSGLMGRIENYKGRGEGTAIKMVANIQPTLEDKVDASIKEDDPDFPWTADKFKISATGDSMLIGFHNIKPTNLNIRRLNPA